MPAPDLSLDRTFSALGDSTRRSLLNRLRGGSLKVTQLAEPFDVSLNAISKHLRVLERAGLIRREIRGREHHCFLEPARLREVAEWTATYRLFWEEGLDALDTYLREAKERRK